MQAHGRTADADRPITYEQMADDVDRAAPATSGFDQADVAGFSMGGALAWIAAVVVATISLPDLAWRRPRRSRTSPRKKRRPAGRRGTRRSASASRCAPTPRSSSATRAASRTPRSAARSAPRAASPRTAPRPARHPRCAADQRRAAAANRGTTAITYLYFAVGAPRRPTTAAAHRYADSDARRPAAARSSASPARPRRARRSSTAIEDSLPLIEAASIALILVVVALAFRSLGAPLVTLAHRRHHLPDRDPRAALARRAQRRRPCRAEVEPIIIVLLLGLVTDYSVLLPVGDAPPPAPGRAAAATRRARPSPRSRRSCSPPG